MTQEFDDGGPAREMALRELLTLALLGGFVHDVGSPLAALTSNLSVARELATADDEDSRGELREVIDDLQMATTRLTELASDLRGYVGLPVGRGTFEELALTALRLGRSHLARRAQVDVAIDPELKPELPPSRVLRTLGELVVAVTHELQSGSRRHLLTIRTDPSGFVIELAPPPPGDVEAPVAIATSRLTQPAQISRTAERLVVRVPLAWS